MDMKKYMTFSADWSKYLGEDDDTMTITYGPVKKIKVFKFGKDIFLRGETSSTTVTAQAYLTLEHIKPKDKLDNRIVKSVNSYPESWDNKNVLYEAYTYDSGDKS